MKDARRIPSLDGLRGLAAIAVMEFHFNIFFLPQARLPYLGRAYLAVDLFFLVSGFVIAHVYGRALALDWRAHWRNFAIARFARLYPVFAVTTLVMVVVVVFMTRTPMPISFSGRTLALQPFLLQQWASGLSWNYPSWSISTEAEAYIYFVFFAGLLITGKNPRLIAACCIVILIALSVSNGGPLNYFVGIRALLRTLAEFSLGALLYRASVSDAGRRYIWTGLSAFLLAGFAMVTHLDFLMVGAFGCLIYCCVDAKNILASRFLNSRPLVILGDWSYSIYLWHAPTHYCVMAIFAAFKYPVSNLSLSSARLLILSTTLFVVCISAVHYQLFEMPMRRLIVNVVPGLNRLGKAGGSPPHGGSSIDVDADRRGELPKGERSDLIA
jgi:peptidoglycan/LPS O-acetylase OafA/YrhL